MDSREDEYPDGEDGRGFQDLRRDRMSSRVDEGEHYFDDRDQDQSGDVSMA